MAKKVLWVGRHGHVLSGHEHCFWQFLRNKLKCLALLWKCMNISWSRGPSLFHPHSHPLVDGGGMPPTRPSEARLPWPLWYWIRSLNPWQEKTGGHSAALQTVCLEALWKSVHTGCQDQQVGWEYGGDSTWRRRRGWPGFFTRGKTGSWVYRKRLKGMWRRKPVHPQRSWRPRDSRAERNNGSLCLLPGLPFAQHHPGMWGPKGGHPGATGSLGLSRLGSQKRPWSLFLMKKDLSLKSYFKHL